jgi:protein-tyrosine phosphatase
MIDIHCHILPGVDDGAEDWEECLRMARIAVEDGIETIVATPHWPGDEGGASRSDRVQALAREVQERLDQEGIPLRVLPGHELVILPEILDELASGGALSCPPEGTGTARYALLETPYHHLPFFLRDILFQVQSRGFTPILAHPERNPTVQSKPETVQEFVAAGCLVQVTAGSLLGQFGGPAQKTARTLLRRGWAHVIATDAHSPENRPPRLSGAVQEAAQLIGEEAARRTVESTPAAVVRGIPLDLRGEPAPPVRPSFWQRLFRAG